MTYRIEYMKDRFHGYQYWAEVCYRALAEAICRREGRASPGKCYRVVEVPTEKVVWAGRYPTR